MRVLCALALVVAVAGLPLVARAAVVVTECATIETPVNVQHDTSFTVTLQRDPTSAASARIDFVADDPDNFRGKEVGARIDPVGDTLPDFNGFNATDYNDRRYSFSGTISKDSLTTGENTLVFEDFDDRSPFLLERLCLTLVDAPLPAPRPISEVFCAQGVVGPSPFDNGGEQAVALPGTLTFDIDVPISAEAEVALDLIVNVADNQGGPRTITLRRGEEVLSGTFDAQQAAPAPWPATAGLARLCREGTHREVKNDPAAFLEALEQEPLPRVVGVGGPERAFVDDVLAIVRRRALEGAIAEFNHDRVNAKERSGDEIAALARTLPTMAPRRLVEVHDAEHLAEASALRLFEYLERPADETVLLFVFQNLDLRARLSKAIQKAGALFRFDHPRERELPGLVRARARRHKLALSAEAAEALALTVGTDLGLLERALEKLALAVGEGEVSLEQISEHVADTHLEDAFRLARAIADVDRGEALRSLSALEAARTPPLQLVGVLAWQLRQLVRARELVDAGCSADEVARSLNIPPFRARPLVFAARRLDARQHRRRLLKVAQADLALKSSRADPWRWMERLVFELCPERPTRAQRERSARTSTQTL